MGIYAAYKSFLYVQEKNYYYFMGLLLLLNDKKKLLHTYATVVVKDKKVNFWLFSPNKNSQTNNFCVTIIYSETQ